MNPVVEALRRPGAYPHPAGPDIRVVETHISWIFLTGRYAYKLKKPVDLGFLDFSTPEKRERFCREEIRLNRRLCPDLYLEVMPVVAVGRSFRVGGEGPVVDHVVRMVQFDRSRELDRLLARDELTPVMLERLASAIAAFHRSAPRADADSPFGNPEVLIVPMLENFEHGPGAPEAETESGTIERLRTWTVGELGRIEGWLRDRKAGGFIRECHGDMHTGNMVSIDDRIAIFDCIEFNPRLSVIDIVSDTAFLFMDLEHSGRKGLAWRFMNAYLSELGDYAGLRLLRFYCTYRAMVRAKVTAIRYRQETDEAKRKAHLGEHRSYVELALGFTRPQSPVLILTTGLSGSGKSALSRSIAAAGGFVHIRSDVERKRLFGLRADEGSASVGIGIYSSDATEKTYRVLLEAAEASLEGGYTTIVDATFLKESQRRPFIELAGRLGRQCRLLMVHAPVEVMKQRILARLEEGSDPSEADIGVLELQLRSVEPPTPAERPVCIEVDTSVETDHEGLAIRLSS